MPDATVGAEDRQSNETTGAPDGVLLPGVDGGTPLGFFAALGLLRLFEERQDPQGPKLSWRQLDAWRPILHIPASFDDIASAVADDAQAWADSALLKFRYVKVEKKGPKTVGGLRAPLAVVRAWQLDRRRAGDELSLEYAAALLCDGTTETIKEAASLDEHRKAGVAVSADAPLTESVERTFFDFTARNAQFLEQVEHIRAYLDADKVRVALERGEPDANAPRSLDWDPAADTPAAIYTGYSRGFLPVHEWLAFRGLVYFPITGDGRRVHSTGCSGRRLAGQFAWPLWTAALSAAAVRSLVAYPNLKELTAERRRALGIGTVLCVELTKKADGRSGTFSPARPPSK